MGTRTRSCRLRRRGMQSAKIVRGATLKVYAGAPHGLAQTHQDRLNADLFAFIQG